MNECLYSYVFEILVQLEFFVGILNEKCLLLFSNVFKFFDTFPFGWEFHISNDFNLLFTHNNLYYIHFNKESICHLLAIQMPNAIIQAALLNHKTKSIREKKPLCELFYF